MKRYYSLNWSTNCIILVVIGLSYFQAHAFEFTPEVCERYGLGKHWYCEQKEEAQEAETTANDVLQSTIPPEQKAVKLNELWEKQRKVAVITQKESDIYKFLDTHNLIVSRGIGFARNVQRLIESNPKYSNSQSYYRNVADEELKEAQKQEILSNASQRYGLVFVYSSGCPYCARQLPVLFKLKQSHGFKILGISADGEHFEGLDETISNPGIVNDPNIQSFPTIMLLDKQKPAKIFISKGLTTLDELTDRIVNRIKEREAADETNS